VTDDPIAAQYDAVTYPSGTFLQTHPNRLAVLARMHGLSAPEVETARVLEIGGGDGLNVIAMAAAWPRATFVNIDLAENTIARGTAMIERAGLTNVHCIVGDILDLPTRYPPGSFDYVIAHGVYAWVPQEVRDAIMALCAHVLSSEGMAFISFNAMPGGHIRRILRDMTLHAIEGVQGNEARLAAAEAFLADYRTAKPDDDDIVRGLRKQAEAMLSRPRAGLFHDELGPVFAPHSLTEVAHHAAMHGLEFLTDAGSGRTQDGLLGDDEQAGPDPTAQVLRHAQREDYEELRYFRQIVLVRRGRAAVRHVDAARLEDLFVGGTFERTDDGQIRTPTGSFGLEDDALVRKLLALSQHWPRYRPIADVADNDEQRTALLDLWHLNFIFLSTTPERFAVDPGIRPTASPLVRAQIAMDMPNVCSLHHEAVGVEDPAARALLAACDGTRDREALEAVWGSVPHNPAVTIDIALGVLARERLMSPPA
jgi:predicted O-methyltransferase YrrM